MKDKSNVKRHRNEVFVANNSMSIKDELEKCQIEVSEKKSMTMSDKDSVKVAEEMGKDKVKVDRPFRSRLPKLKMFIPRRPKSSSRNRNEDTKAKQKPTPKSKISPKPSPRVNRANALDPQSKKSPKQIHRIYENPDLQKSKLIHNSSRNSPKLATKSIDRKSALNGSPAVLRKKSQNTRSDTTGQPFVTKTNAIINTALAPSPAASPLVTSKQQKERENEQEKLKLINEILRANLPSANKTAWSDNQEHRSNVSNQPSKIPVFQSSHVSNRYQNEVSSIKWSEFVS